MRFLVLLVVLAFVAFGIVLGALNADMVSYDLGFAHLELPKGAALLAALFIGWLIGGLTAWWGATLQHRKNGRHRPAAGKVASAP